MLQKWKSQWKNTPLPTFGDSLLEFQFNASDNEISLFRDFIGRVANKETPTFFKEGKPPKPHKSFTLLLNDLRDKEIKDLTKKLDKEGNPNAVIYRFNKALDFWKNIDHILAIEGVKPHIYGKKETRPFRKMGHVTIVNKDLNVARKIAEQVKETIEVISK